MIRFWQFSTGFRADCTCWNRWCCQWIRKTPNAKLW